MKSDEKISLTCYECGFKDPVDRDEVRAVLEGIYEDARSAITAPVHHALMQSAARLERLLGISPAGSDVAFKLAGDGK